MKYLKLIGLIVMFPLMGFNVNNGDSAEYKVIINPQSNISVNGKSNVNSFSCDYSGLLSADTLFIRTTEKGADKLLAESAINVKVSLFDCGMRQMTNDMMDLLKEEEYPHLTVHVTQIERVGNLVKVVSDITIAGKKANYTLFTRIGQQGGWSRCKGNLEVNLRTFGLEPPRKLLGAIQVKEMISIEFDLMLKIIEVT